MGGQLLEDVRRFLGALETTQDELAGLFRTKRTALTKGQPDRLLELAQSEARLTSNLKELLDRRSRILDRARQNGIAADSLTALVNTSSSNDGAHLQPRLERARLRSDELRRESWIHWVIAHRAYNHYSELLEIIAHCGRKCPTYSRKQGEEQSAPGGAILDASA